MNKDTIKEVIESAGEVSWWTLPHFMKRVEGTDYKGLLHVGRQENIEKLLQEVFEQGRKEGVEMAIEAQPRRRIFLHSVVAKGSQEDLNDTWRKGYNDALDEYQFSLTKLL